MYNYNNQTLNRIETKIVKLLFATLQKIFTLGSRMPNQSKTTQKNSLVRDMGIIGLTATGICSMLGASINVVPFMIQRNVEGIGPYVLPAFLFAAIPAIFAAFAYSILASAMPRAGGSYIYASRGLNPYLGFIASFSQWFGLSIVIGVIAYVIVPFIRDVFIEIEWLQTAEWLEIGYVRISIALLLIWTFVYINIRGAKAYTTTLIPLMILMFGFGAIVIIAGFYFNHEDFQVALEARGAANFDVIATTPFNWTTFFSAAALLFSSFIGFDSIAQAGGEAKDPTRSLPKAIFFAILIVGVFYFVFTLAVYHAVPWSYVAQEAMARDISAPGLLSYLLPPTLSVAILAGAAIALINDLPAMLLSVSRLMFAWASDGVFPRKIKSTHHKYHTPHIALIISGVIASIGVLGSHFAGDFFLGIDIMVTSMMINFLLMCITLVSIRKVNPEMANNISILKSIGIQSFIGWAGILMLCFFLIMHISKDINSDAEAWYYHSTPVWIIVMTIGTLIYVYNIRKLKNEGVDVQSLFRELPSD